MGITVPANVVLYDDANNTNHPSAPGTHTDAEIAALVAASFVSNAGVPPDYLAGITLQLGDNPGSAFTSLTITKDGIKLAAGKQLTALASAGPNTWLKAGTKIGSGNVASGKRGLNVGGGSGIILPCNIQAYCCNFVSETGGITLGGTAGLTTVELMNCLLSAATVIQIGTNPGIAVLYNVDFQSDTTVATVITNLFTKRMERGTVAATNPVGFVLWNSSVTPEMRDFAFFGAPSIADVRITSVPVQPIKFVKHRWSGGPRFHNTATWNALSPDSAIAGWEYGVLNLQVQSALTGLAQSGIEVRVTDALGLEALPWTLCDADGRVAFGDDANTNYGNAVRVLDYYRNAAISFGYSWRDRGPFMLQGRDPLNRFLPRTKVLGWPQKATTYGPDLEGVFAPILDMVPVGGVIQGGSEEWRPAYA